MNITAVEKATMKSQKITITNEKGRLTPDQIEKLVKDAEMNKVLDNEIKSKIEARNTLEHSCYSYQ